MKKVKVRAWGLGRRAWEKALVATRPSPRPQAPSPLLAIAAALLIPTAAHAAAPVTESRHYHIHSDLEPSVTADYAKRLDAMFDEYAKRLADFDVPAGQKFDVYLFARQSEYRAFTGNRLPSSAGIFIPSLRALAGYEESQGREGLRQTLQHEAFHQFAWQAISTDLPIWLDEGLAQIFEEGVWTGNQFLLGQATPARLARLRQDIDAGRLIDFRALLLMSREDFQIRMRDPAAGRSLYNQAWAMTQFLVFATDDHGRPRYRQRLIGWLRDLHAGKPPANAYAANFSDNIDGFQSRFTEWAQTVQPTPLAVYSDRVSKVAELLRLFRQDGLTFNSIDELRQHLTQGQFHLTEARNGQTVTLDENALTYLSDLSGKPWSASELFLDPHVGKLPDVVLRPPQGSTIRARFYSRGKTIDHDLAFE